MEQSDRSVILNNIEELIRVTDYELLKEKCQNIKLLSSVMVNYIEQDSHDEHERHRKLLKKITERGPHAFGLFRSICETDFKKASEILKLRPQENNKWVSISESKREIQREFRAMTDGKTFSKQVTRREIYIDEGASTSNGISAFTEYTGEINNLVDVKKAVKFGKSTKNGIDTYSMQSRNRGVLFLINVIDFDNKEEQRREGAQMDKERLLDVFQQLGFTIFYVENITGSQLAQLIRKLTSSDYLRLTDCLVFGLLTHGCLVSHSTYVEMKDGSYYAVEDIIKEFSNSNCKYLQGKPKIFIFPFCRGDVPDRGIEIVKIKKARIEHDSSDTDRTVEVIGSYSDIAICYATVPGFKTHRHTREGSWYIEGFCKIMAENAHDSTFEDLMKLIDLEVSKKKDEGAIQTGSVEYRGFKKVLYFNPGFYAEESIDNVNNNT